MMVEKLDTWLLDNWFEPTAQKFQIKTGHTCYYIAWWFMGLALLAEFIHVGTVDFQSGLLFWLAVGPFPIFMTVCVTNLYKLQKLWEKSDWTSVALSEKRTWLWMHIRVFMIGMTAVLMASCIMQYFTPTGNLLGIATSTLTYTFLTLSEYFSTCTPLPPSAFRKKPVASSGTEQIPVAQRDAA